MTRRLLPLVLAALMTSTAAQAEVELVAIGSLDAHGGDLSSATAGPLENGAPGNLLGGLGSGLAYAGCETFLGLPDRGPNASQYNTAVDNTTSYINRFQTLRLSLAPSAEGAELPYALTPELRDTTLLFDSFGLYYGDGNAYGLGDGAPDLNRWLRSYFSGRSDNALPFADSGFPLNGRLDPEGIRVSANGRTVFISDEYGPYVYEFERRTGRRVDTYRLPSAFYVRHTAPVGQQEIDGNTSGRVANKGMEGLAISPDGRYLFGAMQSPLLQDGGTNAGYTRIVRIDTRTHRTRQYAYPLTNTGTAENPKYGSISEIIAINEHEFLVDERDGKGFGDGSVAKFKRIFHIDLQGAAEVDRLGGEAALAGAAVQKTEFLNLVDALGAHGIAPAELPAKIEGLAFGPDLDDGRHTLFIANDNDFLATVTDERHPDGADNPNRFYVFAFGEDDLPGYEPQNPHCRN